MEVTFLEEHVEEISDVDFIIQEKIVQEGGKIGGIVLKMRH